MLALNTTIVKTIKDIPLPQSSISYRTTPDGEWIYAEFLSKAGKVIIGITLTLNGGKNDSRVEH